MYLRFTFFQNELIVIYLKRPLLLIINNKDLSQLIFLNRINFLRNNN